MSTKVRNSLVGVGSALVATLYMVPVALATEGPTETSLKTVFTTTAGEVLGILVLAIGAAATVIAFIIGATVGVKKLRTWMK